MFVIWVPRLLLVVVVVLGSQRGVHMLDLSGGTVAATTLSWLIVLLLPIVVSPIILMLRKLLIVQLILLGIILLTVISVFAAATLVVVAMLLACCATSIVLGVACRSPWMIVGCIPLALLTLSHPRHKGFQALGTDLLPLLETLARLVHLSGVGDLPDRPSWCPLVTWLTDGCCEGPLFLLLLVLDNFRNEFFPTETLDPLDKLLAERDLIQIFLSL